VVIRDLLARSRARLDALPETELVDLLQDALYSERKRLERARAKPGERERLDALARALVRGDRAARVDAGLDLVRYWSDEVHGHFDPKVYRFATRLLPRAVTGLLTRRTADPRRWDLAPERRLEVTGDLALLRTLAQEATLVLVPTHISNLDSPLIGLALHLAGLPPFVYGAGLNLFSNPVMGWFMGRLGAYTVDRTKRATLYKEVLKDYSVRCLTTRHHSLFFPGGTRSRSGAIEPRIKKGLLGTGIAAWQEMLAAGRPDSEVYIVPLTLTFQLVLEASTLIGDHLEEVGRQRYIIDDDESADARRMAEFFRRILDLDSGAVARFGTPLDVLGNPVSADPIERAEQARLRRGYVCDRNGKVEADAQRDHIYTDRLSQAIVAAWPKGHQVMANHLVAWLAWRLLEDSVGTRDPFRLVQTGELHRRFPRAAFTEALSKLLRQVHEGAAQARWHSRLGLDTARVLDEALERFTRYHRTRAVAAQGSDILIEDPKLCLYYRNRCAHMGLELT
jgi:glycerol-3-phosphate O-acyltransferase